MEKISKVVRWFLTLPENTPPAALLIRVMAGGVFSWEGIIKFVFVNQGVGRFTKLGIPFPEIMAPFVGSLELGGGLLLILGLGTRLICVPLIIDMVVAMLSTKIPMYLGTYPLAPPPVPPQTGGWAVLHEIRSEYAQFFCCLFLLWVGPGKWSLDQRILGSLELLGVRQRR